MHGYEGGKTSIAASFSLSELKEDLTECGEYVDSSDIFAYPFGIYNRMM